MPEGIVVFVPTLDRDSLPVLLDSLKGETVKLIRGKDAPAQMMKAAMIEDCKVIAIADDDAIPPPDWLQKGNGYFSDPLIGYVCGSLIDPDKHNYAQIVQSSFLGSFLMRDRYRIASPGEVDEIRIHGMGLYRRTAFIDALSALGNIPLPGWENTMATWLIANRFKVVYAPELSSDHPSRGNLKEFFKQKFKEGKGRSNYFRVYPKDALKKPFFFLPVLPLLLIFVWPINIILLGVYLSACLITCRNPKVIPWFFTNHIAYGLGLIWGLIR